MYLRRIIFFSRLYFLVVNILKDINEVVEMKKIKLTKEEKQIEDSLMRGEYIKVKGASLNKIQKTVL